MRGDEYDRYAESFGLELRLQVQAGHARHANVADHTRGLVSGFEIKELFRRGEAECGQSLRFD